ncbi:MAG TPA: hypothetical protein VHV30_12250 [Polyangiaceae bacterium]|jgi:hypothetical protein|nr:hypothetical protein [Polyangiaceae bacterium]
MIGRPRWLFALLSLATWSAGCGVVDIRTPGPPPPCPSDSAPSAPPAAPAISVPPGAPAAPHGSSI